MRHPTALRAKRPNPVAIPVRTRAKIADNATIGGSEMIGANERIASNAISIVRARKRRRRRRSASVALRPPSSAKTAH